jgi:hypothetical protein
MNNVAMDIFKNSKKPSQLKRKLAMIFGNLTKRVTRIEGMLEDFSKFLANHGGPKGTNKSKKVMKLLGGNPPKVGNNLIFPGASKKRVRKKSGLRYVLLHHFS